MPGKWENRGRYRRALKRPNTSSTSPMQIEMASRRVEALELRVQSYSYEQIVKHLGVTKSTINETSKEHLRASALILEKAPRGQ